MAAVLLDVEKNQNIVTENIEEINVESETARRILDEGNLESLDRTQAFLLPCWYDEHKFRRGQRYFHDNYFALFVSKLCGLLAVLVVPSILKVLVLTGQSSEPFTAFKRYLDTLSHMLEWYDGDLKNPNSKACKSLLNIRGQHCNATRKACKAGMNNISQRDMSLTLFGFMGFAILRPKELGLTGSDKDVEGFIHFWRVIGYLIGIKDNYNLCCGDLKATREACQVILDEVFNPGLQNPPQDFEQMSHALLEGVWPLVPTIDTEAFLNFTKILSGVNEVKTVKFYSQAILNLQLFVQGVLLNTIIAVILRPILNFNMWLAVVLTQRFPLLAFITFGRNVCAPDQYKIKSSLVAAN